MSNYYEKLKDPRWQRKRLELFASAGWQCSECLSETKTLHAHHRYYVAKRDPWEYPSFAYLVLCDSCHQKHGIRDASRWAAWESFLEEVHNIGGRFFYCTVHGLLYRLAEKHGNEETVTRIQNLSREVENQLIGNAEGSE